MAKSDSEKMYLIAKARFEEGRLERAINILEEIIAGDPDYLRAYYSLAYAFLERGEDNKAETVLLKLTELSPEWDAAHLQLGKAYENQQKWTQALVSYQRAVELNPENPYAHVHLGIIHQVLGNAEASVRELSLAYQLGLSEHVVIYNLALGLYQLGELKESLSLLNKAILTSEIDDRDIADLYRLRGKVHLDLDHLDNAYSDFQRAREKSEERDTDLAEHYVELGRAYSVRLEVQKAIGVYSDALVLNPENVAAHYNLGLVLAEEERIEEALESFQEAVQLAPELADARCSLGITYRRLGRLAEAREELQKAISLDPENSTAYHSLGILLCQLEQWEQAVEMLKKAIQLGESAHHSLGYAYWSLNRLEEAAQEFQKAVDAGEDFISNYYVGMLQLELGNESEALQALERFVATAASEEVEEWADLVKDANREIEDLKQRQ
jgi:protein O-GlcNAc transferase